MPNRTALFSRQQPGGVFTIADIDQHPGDVWFVDSGQTTTGADAVGYGRNPDAPFLTIDYAVGQCTANQGDVIYVLPGHAETQSASGSLLAADVAGITIQGLGSGADRPTLTLSHTGAAMTISAASITWRNLLIVAGVDSVTAPLTISAADCTLEEIEWRDTTDIELVRCLTTTAAADRLTIRNCFHNGFVTGNACVNFARLIGVDGCLIEGCRFNGNYSTAIIEFHTTACTKVVIQNCLFNDTDTTDLSDNVVDTVTGSTWFVDGYDLSAGGGFSGGSGAAVATDDVSALAASVAVIDEFHDVPAADNVLNAQINEVIGNKTDAAAAGAVTTTDTLVGYIKQLVTQAVATSYPRLATATSTANLTSADLWTFTGSIEIIHLIGRVTTVHPAAANTCKLTITPDAFAAYDICAATDLTGMDAGTLLSITGTAAGTLVVTDARGAIAPGQANSVVATCITNGTISTVFSDSGNQSGAIAWEMLWRPLSAAATIT